MAAIFLTYSEARKNFRALLDRSAQHRAVGVAPRNGTSSVIVETQSYKDLLRHQLPTAVAVAENGGWSLWLEGVPVGVDGDTLNEAVDELIDDLRVYADQWNEQLHLTPNHQRFLPLVHFIELSTDTELRGWITGTAA